MDFNFCANFPIICEFFFAKFYRASFVYSKQFSIINDSLILNLFQTFRREICYFSFFKLLIGPLPERNWPVGCV
jgi:hypothetical protein